MALVISKTSKDESTPAKKVSEEIGQPIELSDSSRLDLIKKMKKHAIAAEPDFVSLTKEMGQYLLSLPTDFDVTTLQEAHKLFSLINSYLGRVVEIESIANGNKSRWDRLVKLLKAHIEEKSSSILLSEECVDLPNARLQDAFVRQKLKKYFSHLSVFNDKLSMASAFFENVVGKRKYLNSSYQALSRQVSTLESELRTLSH